jgi:WD40 repeat protein
VGSRDRSLSVWLTALQRPVVVIYELFQDSILDLSWSTDRHILLACSTDGTVACIKFSEEELGTSLSEEEKVNFQYFTDLYRRWIYRTTILIDVVISRYYRRYCRMTTTHTVHNCGHATILTIISIVVRYIHCLHRSDIFYHNN